MEQGRIDQYKKETSQIHAPEDLIRRTKEAVRGEEERIAREKAPQKTAAKKKRYGGRAYRWALPAAAAVLVIVAGTSGIFFGRGADKFMSESALDMTANDTSADDTSAESNMELQLGVSSGADADGAEPIGRGGSNGMTEDAEIYDAADAEMPEAAGAEMSNAVAEDAAVAKMPDTATEDAAVAKMPDTAVKEAATAEMSDAIAEDTADTGISEAAAEDTVDAGISEAATEDAADAEMSDTATDNTAAAVNGAYNSIAETGPDTAAADAVQSDDIYSSLKELADTVYRLLVQTIR